MRDAEIVEALRAGLAVPTGRQLYGVLGSYELLDRFAKTLQQATTPTGHPFPAPRSVNRGILAAIPDDDYKRLAADEARYPEPVRAHVQRAFEQFLRHALREHGPIVLAHMELLFPYSVELSVLRTLATDSDQVILLLPGKRTEGRIALFAETDSGSVFLPANLVAANHLWVLGT
jgi:hypothetical protein